MKNKRSAILLLPLVFLFTAAILAAVQKPVFADETAGLKIMEKEAIGRYLADGNGITLYSFARDEKNVSTCIEGCAANWPPFYLDPSAVVEGCDAGDFDTIIRSDGRKQTTFKGMPLYYFKNDQYPGDTFGRGLGDAWFLITP